MTSQIGIVELGEAIRAFNEVGCAYNHGVYNIQFSFIVKFTQYIKCIKSTCDYHSSNFSTKLKGSCWKSYTLLLQHKEYQAIVPDREHLFCICINYQSTSFLFGLASFDKMPPSKYPIFSFSSLKYLSN